MPIRRWFFYMPFQHSESITDQETALRLYANLPEHPDEAAFVEAAHWHHAIVARFGRFPHRNRILGRDSSAEEEAYLQLPNAAFDSTVLERIPLDRLENGRIIGAADRAVGAEGPGI